MAALPKTPEFLQVVNTRISEEYGSVAAANFALDILCDELIATLEIKQKQFSDLEDTLAKKQELIDARDREIKLLQDELETRKSKLRAGQAARKAERETKLSKSE